MPRKGWDKLRSKVDDLGYFLFGTQDLGNWEVTCCIHLIGGKLDIDFVLNPQPCRICGNQGIIFEPRSESWRCEKYCPLRLYRKDPEKVLALKEKALEVFGKPFWDLSKQDKTQCVHLLKYGVTHAAMDPGVKKHIAEAEARRTPEEKKASKEKNHQTQIDRYDGWAMQNKEIIDKRSMDNLARNGWSAPAQDPDILKRIQATNLERYGDIHGKFLDKENFVKVSRERYGTDHPMQNSEINRRSAANVGKTKILNIDGKTWEYRGYEGKVIQYLYELGYQDVIANPEINIPFVIFNPGALEQELKFHYHHPDIKVPSLENLLLEVKSDWTYSGRDFFMKNLGKIFMARNLGLNYYLIVVDKKDLWKEKLLEIIELAKLNQFKEMPRLTTQMPDLMALD